MSADAAVYLDSSALVKLVVREPESAALTAWLERRPRRASCALARVEVIRAVRPQGGPATSRARQLLDRVALLRLDRALLDRAGALNDGRLRGLDAIHLAAVEALGDDLSAVATYDRRMAEAARAFGFSVEAPA
jgi:predicted nucleic acid-binding protein